MFCLINLLQGIFENRAIKSLGMGIRALEVPTYKFILRTPLSQRLEEIKLSDASMDSK